MTNRRGPPSVRSASNRVLSSAAFPTSTILPPSTATAPSRITRRSASIVTTVPSTRVATRSLWPSLIRFSTAFRRLGEGLSSGRQRRCGAGRLERDAGPADGLAVPEHDALGWGGRDRLGRRGPAQGN